MARGGLPESWTRLWVARGCSGRGKEEGGLVIEACERVAFFSGLKACWIG